MPGNPPVSRVVLIDASGEGSARSTSGLTMKEPPIDSRWPKDKFVNDVNKVKVYHNEPDSNGRTKLVDITGNTKEDGDVSENINEGGEIGKKVPNWSGGDYVVSKN